MREYFDGRRTDFDLPLAPDGTAFQRNVWRRLQEIPYGETISYGELAKRIGNQKASRAVGAANEQNPIPIVIPVSPGDQSEREADWVRGRPADEGEVAGARSEAVTVRRR